jgi:hypothetical protein
MLGALHAASAALGDEVANWTLDISRPVLWVQMDNIFLDGTFSMKNVLAKNALLLFHLYR